MAETPISVSLGILARSRVFQGIPSSDLERLAPRCAYERYRRGATIVRLGEVGDSLLVVGRGRVKGVLPSPHADGEFIVNILWPGDVFGEIPLFDNQSRAATGVAVTEAEILFIPKNEMLALLERRPAVAIRLIEALCDKLRTSLEFSLALRFFDVPSRFYRRLIYLGRYDSRREGNGVRIQHGLSQRELADSIGASREALNKLFGEWKRAGLLEYGRGFVVVPDPAALAMRMPPTVRQGSLVEARDSEPVHAEFNLERKRPRPKR